MAIFMYIADNSKKGHINLKNHNYKDSFLIGLSGLGYFQVSQDLVLLFLPL